MKPRWDWLWMTGLVLAATDAGRPSGSVAPRCDADGVAVVLLVAVGDAAPPSDRGGPRSPARAFQATDSTRAGFGEPPFIVYRDEPRARRSFGLGLHSHRGSAEPTAATPSFASLHAPDRSMSLRPLHRFRPPIRDVSSSLRPGSPRARSHELAAIHTASLTDS